MHAAGLERYGQVARYPENIDVLAGYAPFEVLDADQDEGVEGVVLAEFPPFEQTVEWFNGEAYVQARKNREGNEYLGMLVDSGVTPISKRKPRVHTDCGRTIHRVIFGNDDANPPSAGLPSKTGPNPGLSFAASLAQRGAPLIDHPGLVCCNVSKNRLKPCHRCSADSTTTALPRWRCSASICIV